MGKKDFGLFQISNVSDLCYTVAVTKLYILCGIPFSGKSTLAREMVKILGVERIDLDEVKFELFGKDTIDENLKKEDWDKVYQKMHKQIEDLLRAKKSAVHDTGNFTKYERGLVRKIADKVGGIEIVTIFVDTPYKIAKERLINNRDEKRRFNVTDEDFEGAVAEMERPGADENTLVYDSKIPKDRWINKNLQ